jgi:hypothetical protein
MYILISILNKIVYIIKIKYFLFFLFVYIKFFLDSKKYFIKILKKKRINKYKKNVTNL